jgi:hypothetical protein
VLVSLHHHHILSSIICFRRGRASEACLLVLARTEGYQQAQRVCYSLAHSEMPPLLTLPLSEQQIWQSVRNYLQSIEKLGQSSTQDLSALEEKRRDFIQSYVKRAGSEEVARDTLSSLYRALDRRYEEEQR